MRYWLALAVVGAIAHHVAAELAVAQVRIADSASVRIVSNGSRAQAPVMFRIGSTPLIDVGGLEAVPELEFNAGRGFLHAVMLRSGGLAVADRTRVHIFDSGGRRIHLVGRRGGGPGEFREIQAICSSRGDTVIVADTESARFSVVSPTGEFVRTFQHPAASDPPQDFCFADGSLLTQQRKSRAGAYETVVLGRLRADGAPMDPIGAIRSATAIDLIAQPVVSAVAMGTSVYFADGEGSEIRLLDLTGRTRTLVRTADTPEPIARADAERVAQATVPRNVTGSDRSRQIERMLSRSQRKFWPAFGRVLVEPSGRMWVQSHQSISASPFATVTWVAFSSNGVLEGRLVIPPSGSPGRLPYRVLAFGSGRLLVERIDADGATHLTIYPLLDLRSRIP